MRSTADRAVATQAAGQLVGRNSAAGPVRVAELGALHVRIGLKRKIRHSLAVREETDNLVVRCRLDDGTVGYGEGVPRDYVTGETIDGAIETLAASRLGGSLGPCGTFGEAVEMCGAMRLDVAGEDPRDMRANAARCAVELAVLDAMGRHFGEPLGQAIDYLPEARRITARRDFVRYSMAITAASRRREFTAGLRAWLWGFRQCKVKVGVAGQDDVARLGRIRRTVGGKVDLRVDANESWKPDEVVERIRELEPFGISSVEQPVAHEHVGVLREVRQQVRTKIMHDESLCSLVDARQAIEQGTCDLFNIRLSKCGGLTASVRIAALADEHGLGYQLGCQVGETGILSAAGRHFATTIAGIRYLEGSYDRHLVAERLTVEDLTFGYGGVAPAIKGAGLGVEVDPARLVSVTVREERIALG